MPVFSPAEILLPDFTKVDPTKWAVIACDQFTSEPEYWQAVEQTVGNAPSLLRIILPEIFLGQEDEMRISAIHHTMELYQKELLQAYPDAYVYIERTYADGRVRRGLLGKIDLEAYDYLPGASAPIRATEGTVLSRIPPRVRVRRGAALEAPHVMLLADDPQETLLGPLTRQKAQMQRLYDFPLMLGGGRIQGWIPDAAAAAGIQAAVEGLSAPGQMLFAVGDGNHSLASAKAYYEELKASLGDAAAQHPARYALVEVVNVHDAALEFEPIYRVVFGVEESELLSCLGGAAKGQAFRTVTKAGEGQLFLPPTHTLPVGTLQAKLDAFLATHPQASVDYIHGVDSLRAIVAREGGVGFLFDGMRKQDLFPAVEKDGVLPRKTFSMGEAREKRYYLECRAIR